MSVYFLVKIKITDEKIYQEYLNRCDDVFAQYNGKYLSVDPEPVKLEGEWDTTKTVLIEFPCKEDFNQWYYSDSYQEILEFRLSGASCDAVLIKGKGRN